MTVYVKTLPVSKIKVWSKAKESADADLKPWSPRWKQHVDELKQPTLILIQFVTATRIPPTRCILTKQDLMTYIYQYFKPSCKLQRYLNIFGRKVSSQKVYKIVNVNSIIFFF